jgi:hypothetical protein
MEDIKELSREGNGDGRRHIYRHNRDSDPFRCYWKRNIGLGYVNEIAYITYVSEQGAWLKSHQIRWQS